MDEKLLHGVARRAVQLKMKWCPPTLSSDDLMQEAYVAVLEAEREGTIDPAELQRAAERRLTNVIRRESQRRTVPVAGLEEDE